MSLGFSSYPSKLAQLRKELSDMQAKLRKNKKV